jgi:hypothetical protein
MSPEEQCIAKWQSYHIRAGRPETVFKFHVRFGSQADIRTAKRHVRFTPESRHVQCDRPCLLWANSGHLPIMGQPGQSPKMRSGEPPVTTRRHLKFVAVEKATNSRKRNFKGSAPGAVLPLGLVDFGPIERRVAFHSN